MRKRKKKKYNFILISSRNKERACQLPKVIRNFIKEGIVETILIVFLMMKNSSKTSNK